MISSMSTSYNPHGYIPSMLVFCEYISAWIALELWTMLVLLFFVVVVVRLISRILALHCFQDSLPVLTILGLGLGVRVRG